MADSHAMQGDLAEGLQVPEGFQVVAVFASLVLNAAWIIFGLISLMASAMLFAAPGAAQEFGTWLLAAWLCMQPFVAAWGFAYGYRALSRYSAKLAIYTWALTAIATALPVSALWLLL